MALAMASYRYFVPEGIWNRNSKNNRRPRVCFPQLSGNPLSLLQVTWAYESATYRFTGIAMNPHMIRTVWATEYIKSTKNFIDAAYMLGDRVETVLHSYAN